MGHIPDNKESLCQPKFVVSQKCGLEVAGKHHPIGFEEGRATEREGARARTSEAAALSSASTLTAAAFGSSALAARLTVPSFFALACASFVCSA